MKRTLLLATVALVGCSKTVTSGNSTAPVSAAPSSVASAAATASDAVAPPQGAMDPSQGLSLSQTFDVIQGAIAAQGPVDWKGVVHDSNPPPGQASDWVYQRRVVIDNYSYDLPNCTFNFHYRVITDGKLSTNIDAGAPLREAQTIQLASEESLVAQRDAAAGHSSYTSRIVPAIYDVDVLRADGVDNAFSFYDLGTATRVAQLFYHAAQLCGVNPAKSF